jgi:hypothetical protein
MQALLTPAQKAPIGKTERKKNGNGKSECGARAEKMKIKLGLSDAQPAS